MKICRECNASKPLYEFGRHTATKDGVRLICKECANKQNKLYFKTIDGLISRIYHAQRDRSKLKNMDMPNYSKQEFTEWLMNNGFYAMYCQWFWSNYDKMFTPSPDRLDDYKPYTFDNLRLITWKENFDKGHSDRKNGINNKRSKAVVQIKDGEIVGEYYSSCQAERDTGINQGHISSCCTGNRKSTGGFQWSHATNT